MVLLRSLGLCGLLLAGVSMACAGENARVVVELFTSQGCSSCPPADALLGELAESPGTIALSLPVDYWDYLGWKDTLAMPTFSARQKGYGETRGDRHVYTPQAVINGMLHAVGSDRSAIGRAEHEAAERPWLSLSTEQDGGLIRVSVPAGTVPAEGAAVYLLPLRRHSEVEIGRGENSGRTMSYVNVVRDIVRLGEWTGDSQSFEAPASAARVRDADAYVAVLQSGTPERPGPILGAVKGPGL